MIRSPLLFALVLIAGCGSGQVLETTTVTPSQHPDEIPVIPPQYDNDATRNCLTLDGTLTIRTGAGPGSSLCTLPGGAEVDVEQLFRETRG